MSDLREVTTSWIDARMDSMLAAPQMWGSREAVELQALLLVELRSVVMRPTVDAEDSRRVLDAYAKFLARRFPNATPAPLFEHACREALPETTFTSVLREFSDAMRVHDEGGAPNA